LASHLEDDDKWGAAETYKHLAELARQRHDYRSAREFYHESLGRHREVGRKQLVVDCLRGLAHTEAEETCLSDERAEYVACLLGASQAATELLGLPVPDSEKTENEQLKGKVKDSLGARFVNAWASGRIMTLDQAAQHAVNSRTQGESRWPAVMSPEGLPVGAR
jgi:hypothetical protein